MPRSNPRRFDGPPAIPLGLVLLEPTADELGAYLDGAAGAVLRQRIELLAELDRRFGRRLAQLKRERQSVLGFSPQLRPSAPRKLAFALGGVAVVLLLLLGALWLNALQNNRTTETLANGWPGLQGNAPASETAGLPTTRLSWLLEGETGSAALLSRRFGRLALDSIVYTGELGPHPPASAVATVTFHALALPNQTAASEDPSALSSILDFEVEAALAPDPSTTGRYSFSAELSAPASAGIIAVNLPDGFKLDFSGRRAHGLLGFYRASPGGDAESNLAVLGIAEAPDSQITRLVRQLSGAATGDTHAPASQELTERLAGLIASASLGYWDLVEAFYQAANSAPSGGGPRPRLLLVHDQPDSPWIAQLSETDRAGMARGAERSARLMTQHGFSVDHAAAMPRRLADLAPYQVVMVTAYNPTVNPTSVPLLRSYLEQGGGVVLTGGVPSLLCTRLPAGEDIMTLHGKTAAYGGLELDSIADWFGFRRYGNVDGERTIALAEDGLLGLKLGRFFTGVGAAAIVADSRQAQGTVIAQFEGTGLAAAVCNTYRGGRVFWTTSVYEELDPLVTLNLAGLDWASGRISRVSGAQLTGSR